jgi:KaiC/GvpD/RAD55 family RecA-like ATPase
MAEASGGSTLPPQGKDPQAREEATDRLESGLGISREQAERLQRAGFDTPDDVRAASAERLQALNFTPEEVTRLREGTPAGGKDTDALLEKWLQDRQKAGTSRTKPKRPGIAPKSVSSSDAQKRWLAGDDPLSDSWLKESPPTASAPPTGAAPATAVPVPPPPSEEPDASAPPPPLETARAPAVGSAPAAGPTPIAPDPFAAPVPPLKVAAATPPSPPPLAEGPSAPTTPSGPTFVPELTRDVSRSPGPRAPPLKARAAAAAAAAPAAAGTRPSEEDLRAREETVLRWLTELLDKAKSENFDPGQLLREAQDLTRQLHEERGRRRELEEELEHVKKGSVAVIKYVRNREARAREEAIAAKEADILELRRQLESARASGSSVDTQKVLSERDTKIHQLEEELEKAKTAAGTSVGAQHELNARFREELEAKDRSYSEKEAELRRKIIKLEEEVQNQKSELALADRRAQLTKMDSKNLTGELKLKLDQTDAREKAVALKEAEYTSKLQELMVRADELEKMRAPIAYKEQEIVRWEEELRIKEQKVTTQMRELETAKKEQMSPETMGKLRKLEDLNAEITKREEEIRSREAFINQKLEALERKERDVSDEEVARSKEEMKAEVEANKVKTGVQRLDDLLMGGVPLGTNLLINAPSHTGKDLLGRLLAAEGLKKGVPVLWILSDKATSTVREEMTVVLPSYGEYEKKGLVRYVDLYSSSLGITTADPLVKLLSMDDKSLLENLGKAVDEVAVEFKQKSEYYRCIFETISTVTTYLDDVSSTFRFLQPFVGKRKRDRAVSYYMVDTGMHGESDLQVLEHMMDGSVNLKVDQLKTYLSVKGLTEVQSRAWIQYSFTKKVFNMGSFSLELIR